MVSGQWSVAQRIISERMRARGPGGHCSLAGAGQVPCRGRFLPEAKSRGSAPRCNAPRKATVPGARETENNQDFPCLQPEKSLVLYNAPIPRFTLFFHFYNRLKEDEAKEEKPLDDDKRVIKTRDMHRLAEYREYLRSHPRLTYLFAELTDRCNLSCLHCGSSCGDGRGRNLDTALLLRTLEDVSQDFEPRTVMICLTGGEPLLHPDFFTIADRIHSLGFPWGITTNGTLIDSARAQKMAALGLNSVTLSLDGLEETHDALRRVKGSFRKVLSAVEHLHSAGIKVQITSVIHTGNYCELERMFELMCDLKVESWRVINIEPIGRALEHPELLLSDKQMLGLLNFIREKRYSASTPMDVCFGCSHDLSFEYEHELRDNYFICGSGI